MLNDPNRAMRLRVMSGRSWNINFYTYLKTDANFERVISDFFQILSAEAVVLQKLFTFLQKIKPIWRTFDVSAPVKSLLENGLPKKTHFSF